MLTLFLSIICFFVSYSLNLFFLFNAVVPLFWLPYVLVKIINRKLKIYALLSCIIPLIIWILAIFIVGVILVLLGGKNIITYYQYSFGTTIGFVIALLQVMYSSTTKKAREEFKEGLNKFKS